MKLVKLLIVALGLMMVAATSSFAIVPFFATSSSNLMPVNAQTGLAGSVVLTPIAAGTIAAGEIVSVSYNPATITSLTDMTVTVKGIVFHPVAFGAVITDAGSLISVTANASNILISFGQDTAFATTDNIQVGGVRLNVCSFAAVNGTLAATISNVINQAPTTNPTVQVATFIEPIAVVTPTSFGLPDISLLSTAGTSVDNDPEVVQILELQSPNAFETRSSIVVGAAPTKIKVRISNIPAGVTVAASIPAVPPPPPTGYAYAVASIPAGGVVVSGSTATITININDQDPNVLEAIPLELNWGTAVGTNTVPLGEATIAATLAPPINVFTEFVPFNLNTTGLRYCERFTAEQTVLRIVQLTTELLSVFNVANDLYNTGFAIANTTGILQTTTQPGTITVTLYPFAGTGTKSFTTSATLKPGIGLDANGVLPARATWSVLLSQLTAAAGITGDFQGMVRFTTNFSNAHGLNFVADELFEVFAQGYPMLVLPSSRPTAFEGLDN